MNHWGQYNLFCVVALGKNDRPGVAWLGMWGFRSFSSCNSYVTLGTTLLLCELQISLEQQENEESGWSMSIHYGPWMLQQHSGGMSTRLASAPPGQLHASSDHPSIRNKTGLMKVFLGKSHSCHQGVTVSAPAPTGNSTCLPMTSRPSHLGCSMTESCSVKSGLCQTAGRWHEWSLAVLGRGVPDSALRSQFIICLAIHQPMST